MKNLPEWLKLIKGDLDKDDDDEVVMMLHQPIGYDKTTGDGISSERFMAVMSMVPKNKRMRLEINTMGGAIDQGIAMYNGIRARGGVTTRVVGYAASMGSVVFQAGENREMMPGTMVMVHNPQLSPGSGDYKDMEAAAALLKKVKTAIVNLMSDRTGVGKKEMSDMMDATTAIGPEEAVKLGFADKVVDGSPAYNGLDLTTLTNSIKTIISPAKPNEDSRHQPQNKKEREMKLTLAALAPLITGDLRVPTDATDEQAAPIVSLAVNALTDEMESLRNENETLRAEKKTRIVARVDAAITAKVLKPELKDAMVNAALTNESILDAIPAAGQTVRRGAPPVPGTDGDKGSVQEQLATLRNQMLDPNATPAQRGAWAKEARKLRGHGSIFQPREEVKAE